MTYLIDGNNLIGFNSPQHLTDPQVKRDLVAELEIFQQVKKTRVHLVFDGPSDPDITGNAEGVLLFIHFPPPGQSADTVIQDMITRQTDLRRLFVVSSDREIKTFARSKGAKIMTCPEFMKLLKAARKRYEKIMAMKKDAEIPTALEVDQWMDIFRPKK